MEISSWLEEIIGKIASSGTPKLFFLSTDLESNGKREIGREVETRLRKGVVTESIGLCD